MPIDNSAIEREFQNVAKLRLNVLFAGSTEDAHREVFGLALEEMTPAAARCVH